MSSGTSKKEVIEGEGKELFTSSYTNEQKAVWKVKKKGETRDVIKG